MFQRCNLIVCVLSMVCPVFPRLNVNAFAGPADQPTGQSTWQTHTGVLPAEDVRALKVDGQRVWVGTTGGLALWQAGQWRSWTPEDGLPPVTISAIDVDPQTRDVWLGTWGAGLVRFSGGRCISINQLNSGLAGNMIFSILVVGENIWAATNSGVSVWNMRDDSWELSFGRRTDQPDNVITDLIHTDDHVYAGAWCGPLWCYDLTRRTWDVAAPARHRSPAIGLALGRSPQGTLCWAVRDQLFTRSPAGDWRAQPLAIGGNFIQCVSAANDQQVWLGTDNGLAVRSEDPDGKWIDYRPSWFAGRRIQCIAFQREDVWVGTNGGLVHGIGLDSGRALVTATCPPPEAEPVLPAVHADQPVYIGLFRPASRTITLTGSAAIGKSRLGRMDYLAAQLAIEQANARGGYRGNTPFAVATGPEGAFKGWGWTTPEDDFPILANNPDVWGIVGYVGPGSRFTSAVALHSEVPLVNCRSAAPTIDQLINPWTFNCRASDLQRHRLLLNYICADLGCRRLALLRIPTQPAIELDWWGNYARRRWQADVVEVRWDPAAENPAAVLKTAAAADAVLTFSDTVTSAAILRSMRESGMNQLFVGSDQIVNDEFSALVGPDPGAVLALSGRTPLAAPAFATEYAARFQRQPPAGARELYLAIQHLIEAINIAGLDRDAIRAALTDMRTSIDGEQHCHIEPTPDPGQVFSRLQSGRWQPLDISKLSHQHSEVAGPVSD